MVSLAVALAPIVCASLVTCNHDWSDLDPGLSGGSAGNSACPALPPGDVCKSISRLPDLADAGVADPDFCSLPVTPFDQAHAVPTPVGTGGADPDHEKATLRVGWSKRGLHFQIHVEDAHVVPPEPTQEAWEGDAIEIMVKGDDAVTGEYGLGDAGEVHDPGALHLILGAPSAQGVVETAVFDKPSGVRPMAKGTFSGRRVADGYEIYALVDWALLRPDPPGMKSAEPAAGQKISLDFALDMRGPGATSRDAQMYYFVSDIGGPLPDNCAPNTDLLPWCDDLLWCTPALQ